MPPSLLLPLMLAAFAVSGLELHGAVSADGRFSADVVGIILVPPNSGVRLTDLTTGTSIDVPQAPGQGGIAEQVALAPDGSVVVFTAAGLSPIAGIGTQLYRYDAATGVTTWLFVEPGKHVVSIQSQSADGDALVFMVRYLLDPALDRSSKLVQYHFSTGRFDTSPVARVHSVVVATDPGSATATVDPHLLDAGSYDPDGDPLTLRLDPPGPYPIGTTPVDLVVSDGIFSDSTFDAPAFPGGPPAPGPKAVIVVEDREPPHLTAALRRPLILGHDHDLVDIGLRLAASDNSGAVTIDYAVTQDEPVLGTGHGDRAPDAVVPPIALANHVLLRAERADHGDGRVYLVRITASDAAGNRSSVSHAVVVPHDLGLRSLLVAAISWLHAELHGEDLPYDATTPGGDG